MNPRNARASLPKAVTPLTAAAEPPAPQIDCITVHLGPCGIAAGAAEVLAAIQEALLAAQAEDVPVHQAGCAGQCDNEPMITLTDRAGCQFHYSRLNAVRAAELVRQHLCRDPALAEPRGKT